jgi:hypothetical protein
MGPLGSYFECYKSIRRLPLIFLSLAKEGQLDAFEPRGQDIAFLVVASLASSDHMLPSQQGLPRIDDNSVNIDQST